MRELTGRRGVSVKRMIAELNPLLRGWAGYFGFSQGRELRDLDKWIRRRLRCAQWRQWGTWRKRWTELQRRGVSKQSAYDAALSCKGSWRLSICDALHRALSNRTLCLDGLIFMVDRAHA